MKTGAVTPALMIVMALVMGWAATATAGPKPVKLFKEMKGADVVLVPPRSIHIDGQGKATVRHHPLQGYDNNAYPELFGELAVRSFSKGPTRWEVSYVIPEEAFYFEVETNDPDGVPAETISEIPESLAGHEYLAVVRYAEFAYGVTSRPHFTRDDKVVIEHLVFLTIDLQLVLYDGSTGAVVDVFDAQREVEVPEIQAQTARSKAYFRATVGGLQELKKVIRKAK